MKLDFYTLQWTVHQKCNQPFTFVRVNTDWPFKLVFCLWPRFYVRERPSPEHSNLWKPCCIHEEGSLTQTNMITSSDSRSTIVFMMKGDFLLPIRSQGHAFEKKVTPCTIFNNQLISIVLEISEWTLEFCSEPNKNEPYMLLGQF